MHRGSKIAKLAVVTAFSLVITMLFQGGVIQQEEIIEQPKKASIYEVTPKKTAKSSIEKSTEKATEKSTEKADKKADKKTDKKSKKKTKAKEASTEAPTEDSTESPTEFATMKIVKLYSEDELEALSNSFAPTYLAPTEPPTEWTQELQDIYDAQYDAGYLVAIDNPDFSYAPKYKVVLSEKDRILAYQIVQGEAGGEGFESCCIVAQCLRDTMLTLKYSSIKEVQEKCKYDGWKKEYSEDAIKAVDYIFDQNKNAIAHRVMFFYATDLCTSKWHETQDYIVTVNKTRFFDMK